VDLVKIASSAELQDYFKLLAEYVFVTEQPANFREHLEARIDLMNCSVFSGPGKELIAYLEDLTQVNWAASDNQTGYGFDWVMESDAGLGDVAASYFVEHELKRWKFTCQSALSVSSLGQYNKEKTERLHFQDESVGTLPAEVFQFSKLTVLTAVQLELKSLPPEIAKLKHLQELYVQQNSLESLPSELGKLSKLKKLNAERNWLRSLPAELGKLKNLEELHLARNKLQDLPVELDKLKRLKCFDISMNGIKADFKLWSVFDRLAKDTEGILKLSGNKFNPTDREGKQFTRGHVYRNEGSGMCTASFCGAEFLDWRVMLKRTPKQKNTWSQLCVFLEAYAKAQGVESAQDNWHAGKGKGKKKGCGECKKLARYFDAAKEFTDNESAKSHEQYGCKWFHEWKSNIDEAYDKKGQRRFVVFTKVDGNLGVCQTVEWLYLLEKRSKCEGMEIRVASVENMTQILSLGMDTPQELFKDCPERVPTELPSALKGDPLE